MKFDFLTLWFIISPFIILHQFLKIRSFRDKAGDVIEYVNNTWDMDYKNLIMTYGTVKNFTDSHLDDFNIIRSNIAKIYGSISEINRKYMYQTEKLLELIEKNKMTKKEIEEGIKIIMRDICILTDDELTQLNAFLINEEEAHSNDKKIIETLNEIDIKYKNNDIYRDVTK